MFSCPQQKNMNLRYIETMFNTLKIYKIKDIFRISYFAKVEPLPVFGSGQWNVYSVYHYISQLIKRTRFLCKWLDFKIQIIGLIGISQSQVNAEKWWYPNAAVTCEFDLCEKLTITTQLEIYNMFNCYDDWLLYSLDVSHSSINFLD